MSFATEEFSPNMNDSKVDDSASTKHGNVPPDELVNASPKLCGYLNKLSTRGLIKSFKRRWFVYSENTCKLYYYRTPQDILHLGEIDVAKATFSFEVTNLEKPGLFYVSVPEKTYELEAKDRQTCLFWLQELQKRRKIHSRRRTSQILNNCKLNRVHSVGKLESGLLRRNNGQPLEPNTDDIASARLFSNVECPEGAVGEDTVLRDGRPATRSWSFTKLKDHVVSSMAPKRNRQSHELSGSTDANITKAPHIASPPSDECLLRQPPSPTEGDDNVPRRHTAFQWRLSNSFRLRESKTSPSSPTCKKCEQWTDQVASLKDDVVAVEDEVVTCREINRVLQMQIDYLSRQRDTLLQKTSLDMTAQELLNMKDKEIAALEQHVRAQDRDIAALKTQLLSTQKELRSTAEQLALFEEAIRMKDEVVVQLTNQITLMEDNEDSDHPGHDALSKDVTSSESSHFVDATDVSDLENLKDSLQAYVVQNKFLNKEILELNQLRKESEEREDKLLVRCSEWEAKYFQVHSKYLLLLNDLHAPQMGREEKDKQEIVSQLLEDALQFQTHSNYLMSRKGSTCENEYDEYGFCQNTDAILSKAAVFQRRSDDIKSFMEDPDVETLHSRWENFIICIGNKELHRTPEVKMLLRSGVPYEHKGKIWKKCVDVWIKRLRDKVKPGYYQNLLATHHSATTLDPAAKQIELDLLRTLPNNKHYETPHSDGIPRLRRVLLAYSWHNKDVGYCQGLNRLAAIALLFMNEEDAFWCLVAIVEFIMPQDYYSRTLLASQADQRVLKDLLAEKLPRLSNHCEERGIDLTLFTFNWFLCVFVDHNMPVAVYLRIWDTFLFEGSKVLFRYALAFFKMHEEEILKQKDALTFNHLLRLSTENMTDIKRLHQIAFHELNPFRMRLIKSKRTHHLQVMKAELEELDNLRRSSKSWSEPRFEYDSDED